MTPAETIASCTCQRCNSDNATRYRQNTKYVNEEENWVTLCPSCKEENDAYWADMWADFYQGLM